MEEELNVKKHIIVCDKMYESAYGKPDETPETSVCKRMLERGMELTRWNLPEICIHECERWSLKLVGW